MNLKIIIWIFEIYVINFYFYFPKNTIKKSPPWKLEEDFLVSWIFTSILINLYFLTLLYLTVFCGRRKLMILLLSKCQCGDTSRIWTDGFRALQALAMGHSAMVSCILIPADCMKKRLKCKSFCWSTIFLYLVFEFFERIKFLVVTNLAKDTNIKNLLIEVSTIFKYMSLKKGNRFSIRSNALKYQVVNCNWKCIDTIFNNSWRKFNIGCWES